MTISALSLFGCGGGNGGGTTTTDTDTPTDTPTDTSLVFSIFAPEYFDGSYSASYSLAGSDTNGDSYTATQNVESGTVTMYPKPVKEIIVDTSITNTDTNAPIKILDKKYFTYEANNTDIRYFASENSFDGYITTAIAISNEIIPLTATIGDLGKVGDYIRNDGSSFTQSWKLTDGFNGKAKLIVTTTSNIVSDLYPTTIEKLLISQDGTISGFELIITYHQSGNTITLTSL